MKKSSTPWTAITGFAICSVIIVGVFLLWMPGNDAPNRHSSAVDNTVCVGHGGHHRNGTLLAQRDAVGRVTGWTCSFGPHGICTAGPDGVWKECSFPSDLMPWPEDVSSDVLKSPPPALPVLY